ncbi:MAG: hypothetical protein LBP61_09625 [Desulfovibrio sp.]|nr:hypothetical protein [Desulfovibrio sp.]
MAYRNYGNNTANDMLAGMQVGKAFGDTLGDMDMNARMNQIGQRVQQAGGNLTALDPSQFTNPRDIMALGKYQEEYLKTQEGQAKVFDAWGKLAEHQYNQFVGGMQYVNTLTDPDQQGMAITQLTGSMALPFKAEYDPQAKAFNITERDADGRLGHARTVSLDEGRRMIATINSPVDFQRFMIPYAMMQMQRNMTNKRDPKTWIHASDSQGRNVTLVPQTQPGANGAYEDGFLVMRDGTPGVEFLPLEQLGAAGINVADRLDTGRARLGARGALGKATEGGEANFESPEVKRFLASRGYVYDKGWYYRREKDEDGKWGLGEPLSMEGAAALLGMGNPAGDTASADPLGLKKGDQPETEGNTVAQLTQGAVQEEAADTPEQQPARREEGRVVERRRGHGRNNVEYYLVRPDGSEQQISAAEAGRLRRQPLWGSLGKISEVPLSGWN